MGIGYIGRIGLAQCILIVLTDEQERLGIFMGLDITAYRELNKIDCVFDADGEPMDPKTREPLNGDYYKGNVNPDFPGRNEGIEDKAIYCYEKAVALHAGSYSGYNWWREELAKLTGWPKAKYEQYGTTWEKHAAATWEASSGPFWELICFSDCEGVIGPKACAKLAREFEEWQPKADEHPDARWRQKYTEWRNAFALVGPTGAVAFH